MKYIYLLACLLCIVFVASGEVVDCTNNHMCPTGFICASTQKGAGAKYGCKKYENFCENFDYSCPRDMTCNMTAMACENEHSSIRIGKNVDATSSLLTTKVGANDLCAEMDAIMPSFCNCNPTANAMGASIFCLVDILNIEHFEVKALLEPCSTPATFSVDVVETLIPIDFHYDITLGVSDQVVLDGVAFYLPFVGDVQLMLDVGLTGTIDSMNILLAIDGCATDRLGTTSCGADLASFLPVTMIDYTFNFGAVCVV